MRSEGAYAEGLEGTVFNIQRFSIEDGPGIRTTVFLKGCSMRCAWCHNPESIERKPQLMWFDVRCIGARDCLDVCDKRALELTPEGMVIDREACDGCGKCQEACPAGAIEVVGKRYTVDEAVREVERDEAFYRNSDGGVTISGGEPAMQHEFSARLMEACRARGLHVALDTSGYCASEVMEKLVSLADLVLMDIKVMDEDRHRELTGVPLEPILANARYAGNRGGPVWIRTPVIPGMTDSRENVAAIAAFIREEMPCVERWDLLTFNNTCGSKYRRLDMEWPLEGKPLVEKQKMEALADVAAGSGVSKVAWSGATAMEKESAG